MQIEPIQMTCQNKDCGYFMEEIGKRICRNGHNSAGNHICTNLKKSGAKYFYRMMTMPDEAEFMSVPDLPTAYPLN